MSDGENMTIDPMDDEGLLDACIKNWIETVPGADYPSRDLCSINLDKKGRPVVILRNGFRELAFYVHRNGEMGRVVETEQFSNYLKIWGVYHGGLE